MRASTRLRRCAHDVCLRFGRTSCGRSSATQICKVSRKDWVFVEAISEGQVHLSSLPFFFLLAVQMNYDTSLSSPTARYSKWGNGWKATRHLAPLLRHGWSKAMPTSRRCLRNRTFAQVAMSQFSVRVWRVASLKANLLQDRSKP